MVPIIVNSHIHIDFVPFVDGPKGRNTMDDALIQGYTHWFGEPHEPDGRWVGPLFDNRIKDKSINILKCYIFSIIDKHLLGLFQGVAGDGCRFS